MKDKFQSFWFGFTMPVVAFKTITKHPSLIFWSLLPIGITLSLYGLFISQAQTLAHSFINSTFSAWGLDPTGWLAHVMLWIAGILLFLISAVTFSFLSNLVASPFNDFLAEQTEKYSNPPLPQVPHQNILKKLRIVSIDVIKTVVATTLSLLSLVISWVPLVNLIAIVMTLLLISFQFVSYPQTRREQGILYGIQFILKNFFSCLGFGLSFSVLFAIPILSSFCLPLAVVGGTLLVARVRVQHRP